MWHPTEGELRAFLDRETSDEDTARIRAHLDGCPACEAVRHELLESEAAVRDALDRMDGVLGDPDLARARAAVERRLAETEKAFPAEGSARTRRWRAHLRAAAIAILFLGSVSAALPGSPVRAWLLRTLDGGGPDPSAVSVPDLGEPPAPTSDSTSPERGDEASVRVAPRDGTVRIQLLQVSPGTRVRIVLVDGERAGISAPRAVGFRSGAGFIGVTAPSDLVTIELPRSVSTADVRSGNRILLRKEGPSLEFPTITPESDDGGFVFTIPQTNPATDR